MISGLIALASALAGRDFAGEGRTLDRLGLAGRNVKDIVAIVRNGLPEAKARRASAGGRASRRGR